MSSTTKPPSQCNCVYPSDCVDLHPGRYLVAAYWLSVDDPGPVATGDLSDRLGVSPASVTEMVERLADADLVDHEKHRGTELTDRGEGIARELAWRQCTVRMFFDTELGTELGPEEGYRIGYRIPESGVRRLQELVEPLEDACCNQTDDGTCMYGTA